MSGGVAHSEQYNGTPATGITRSDDLGFSKEAREIHVIEKAILQSKEENKVDVEGILSQIRALVDQAEAAVKKVGQLVKLEPSKSESHFVACPYDLAHQVLPEALFKHALCCPSNPKPQVEDSQKLISSLRYPHWQNHDDEEDSGPESEEHETSELGDGRSLNPSVSCLENVTGGGIQVKKGNYVEDGTGDALKASSLRNEIDIWGGRFFYKDSPAVVQAPLPTALPTPPEGPVAPLALSHSADELGAKLESIDKSATEPLLSMKDISSVVEKGICDGEGLSCPLLSSRFWFLQREIETWKEFPTRCSTLVIQAATAVGRLRRNVVSEWVLSQGPAHGVVIDSPMASHIHSLARTCLRSMQREASDLIDHQRDDLVKHKIVSPPVLDEDASHGPRSGRLVARGETDDQKRSLSGNDTLGLKTVKEEEPPAPEVVGGGVGCSSKVSLLDCPHLFQSGHWLASQLSSLFGPLQSKVLVLKLLKHCLVLSGRILASSFLATFTKQQQQATEGSWQPSRYLRKDNAKQTEELQTLKDSEHLTSKDETLEAKSTTLPFEVAAAVAAVRERAILESFLRTLSYPSRASKFQM